MSRVQHVTPRNLVSSPTPDRSQRRGRAVWSIFCPPNIYAACQPIITQKNTRFGCNPIPVDILFHFVPFLQPFFFPVSSVFIIFFFYFLTLLHPPSFLLSFLFKYYYQPGSISPPALYDHYPTEIQSDDTSTHTPSHFSVRLDTYNSDPSSFLFAIPLAFSLTVRRHITLRYFNCAIESPLSHLCPIEFPTLPTFLTIPVYALFFLFKFTPICLPLLSLWFGVVCSYNNLYGPRFPFVAVVWPFFFHSFVCVCVYPTCVLQFDTSPPCIPPFSLLFSHFLFHYHNNWTTTCGRCQLIRVKISATLLDRTI